MSLIARQSEMLSGFDPRSLPGLEAWYDAAHPAGFGVATPADGTALSTWNDLSGKGRHLTQATIAYQPLWRKPNVNLLTAQVATGGDTLANSVSFGGANTSSVSYTTSTAHSGAGSIRLTFSASQTYGAEGIQISVSGLPLSTTMTFSAWFYNPSSSNNPGVVLSVQSPGGGLVAPGASPVSSVKDAWTRLSATFTTTSTVTPVILYVLGNGSGAPTASDTMWGDDFQVEVGATATDWIYPGNPVGVQSDGAKRFLSVAAPTFTTPTIYSVVRVIPPAPNSGTLVGLATTPGQSGGVPFVQYVQVSTQKYSSYTSDGTNAISGISSSTIDYNTHVLGSTQPNGKLLTALDANETTITDTYLPTTQGYITVGCNIAQIPWVISTVLIFSQTHSLAYRRRIENWLAARYSVNLTRP